MQSPGQVVIPSIVGIIGTKLSSVRLMFESLLTTQPWLHDPDVLYIPWRGDAELSLKHGSESAKPAFGLMKTDGIVSPHPPIARALRMVAEALQSKDHEVINLRRKLLANPWLIQFADHSLEPTITRRIDKTSCKCTTPRLHTLQTLICTSQLLPKPMVQWMFSPILPSRGSHSYQNFNLNLELRRSLLFRYWISIIIPCN